MIEAYRLHSSRYPANSGKGAAIRGGRWNRAGQDAIYTAATRSLAALEILAHYAVLPADFVATPARIPEHLVQKVEDLVFSFALSRNLGELWQFDLEETADIGGGWVDENLSAVLGVPSAIVPAERNYVLNPSHPQFGEIEFLSPEPFHFDPRLKASV